MDLGVITRSSIASIQSGRNHIRSSPPNLTSADITPSTPAATQYLHSIMSSSQAEHRASVLFGQLAPNTTAAASSSSSSSSSNNKFTYTADPSSLLTPAQRKQYDEEGYILVKKLVTEEEIATWRQRFLDIANGDEVAPVGMTVMRDVAIAKRKEKGELAITKIQDWQDDPTLFTYCKHPKIAKYVESIIGKDFKSVHTMLINKPPDVGVGSSRHPPHQDLWYFPFRPANQIVASWTAMQLIDRTNGCLFVKPGSHKQGELYKHTYPSDGIVNAAYHGIHNLTEADGDAMVHVPMEIGDTLFFHPLLIHGSGRNHSQGYRKAISCHYASTHCTYEEMTGSIQEDVAKEIEAVIKRKGVNVTYNQFWKMKARLIQGKEDTL